MKELSLAIILILIMKLLFMIPGEGIFFYDARITIAFGFLLVTAYIIGLFFSRIQLPKIAGYIIAGMLFGPHVLKFFDAAVIQNMRIIDQLALTFIALNAGGELRLKELAEYKKRLIVLILLQVVIVLTGILLFVAFTYPALSFLRDEPFPNILVIGGLVGVLSVARSPSTVIAIMQESKAKGAFSETVLGVTVAIDILTILLFAIVVSIGEAGVFPRGGLSAAFFAGILVEILISIGLGIAVGAGFAQYITRIKARVPILIAVIAFLTYNLSMGVSEFVTHSLDVSFHLEPMLIAMTAGFYIQNFTEGGPRFIESIESSALPIYVLFFAMAGMVVDLGILSQMMHIAIGLVVARAAFIWISGFAAGALSRVPMQHAKLYGFGFIAQAGVSIGLAQEITRRFPDWGNTLGVLIIAAININQIVGPITFKYALGRVGEKKGDASGKTAGNDKS